jgi:hypothetical protein
MPRLVCTIPLQPPPQPPPSPLLMEDLSLFLELGDLIAIGSMSSPFTQPHERTPRASEQNDGKN